MRWVPVVAVSTLSLLAAACSKPAAPAEDAAAASATPAAPAAPPPTDEEKLKLLASLPAPYNTGDLANGKAKFALCQSCHTIAEGGANMTGPNLHGVFGRKAASVEGFNYSDALKAAGYTWDPDHLNAWLEAPMKALPGTKMSFAGLKDPKDRTDVIAYLMTETGYKPQ